MYYGKINFTRATARTSLCLRQNFTWRKPNFTNNKDGLRDQIVLYFFDELGNPVDEENAVRFVIRECSENGDLIAETWAFAEHCRENDNGVRNAVKSALADEIH